MSWQALAATCWLLVSAMICQAAPPAVDFDHTVLPILTQAGCNSGACHGAAIGRGGFQLSLYGQNPASDFDNIVRQLGGRRVNLAEPESSLLLRKAGEFTEHGGGMPLPPDGHRWQTVLRWIDDGCRRDADRKLESIRVEPAQWVLRPGGPETQVRVTARFDDGTEADMTRWSLLTADDREAIRIGDSPGTFAAQRPGRHTVIARVRDQVAAIEVIVATPLADTPAAVRRPSASRLDQLVDQKLDLLGLLPNAPLDDAGFLRRVSLDLTGRLPSPELLASFVASERVNKRGRMIDALLASDAAVDYWAYWLARTLRTGAAGQGGGPDADVTAVYHDWLRRQVAACRPLPQMMAELLTANGPADRNGAVGFYLSANDARSQAELFSEVMLGSRLRCANCHNHPLDRWTQDDYHGLAAIFAGVRRGAEVAWRDGQHVIHPGTGEAAVPQLPGGEPIDADGDLRQPLADWLTGPASDRLARAWVNRVWAALLGRGLIDPLDDIRATNPATHPVLLEELAADWRGHGFDLRYLIRRIASSDTYARSLHGPGESLPDEQQHARATAEALYACGTSRPLAAEVLIDAIGDVTDVWEVFDGQPAGVRAVALSNPRTASLALDVLGRCQPGTECQAAGGEQAALSQKLALLCGPVIQRRVVDDRGTVARWAASDPSTGRQVIDAMYRRCLSRSPRPDEVQYWVAELQQAADRRHVIQDLAWSLLTCREFTTNH